MSFTGGCRCGSCRYDLDFSAMPVSYACHCLDCQTMTASAFSLHAVVPSSRFVLCGELEGWSRINGEGTLTAHYVCTVCKTRIHSTNAGRPGMTIVRMGALDESQFVVPLVHMWAKRKQPWIGLPDEAEVYEEAVPTERLKAMFLLNAL